MGETLKFPAWELTERIKEKHNITAKNTGCLNFVFNDSDSLGEKAPGDRKPPGVDPFDISKSVL